MYIVVLHKISDPKKFWETAQASIPNLPAGIKVHCVLPNADGSKSVCLWEADSLDTVKNLIEDSVGDVSKNRYYEVNAESAIGLPG